MASFADPNAGSAAAGAGGGGAAPATKDGTDAATTATDAVPVPATFLTEMHRKYVRELNDKKHTFTYQVTEHLRMSGIYWGYCAMHLLGAPEQMGGAKAAAGSDTTQHPSRGSAIGCGSSNHRPLASSNSSPGASPSRPPTASSPPTTATTPCPLRACAMGGRGCHVRATGSNASPSVQHSPSSLRPPITATRPLGSMEQPGPSRPSAIGGSSLHAPVAGSHSSATLSAEPSPP